MNIYRDSTAAPAQPALVAVEESRPDSHAVDAILSALALLLAALLGAAPGSTFARAIAAQALTLLRAWLRPRARAATPEQHARALRHLRVLHTAHPLRMPQFRPSRAARRRAAECWRILINPPRRRATFARPHSARALPHQALPRTPPPPPPPPPPPAH
ncbi:MAG: hypothetical protein NTY94_09230 [Alphaproteobacteria bacterium]|nr:hypothetical protein [Alphaproteobacteria bacterium]